jgi:hypothetical protein
MCNRRSQDQEVDVRRTSFTMRRCTRSSRRRRVVLRAGVARSRFRRHRRGSPRSSEVRTQTAAACHFVTGTSLALQRNWRMRRVRRSRGTMRRSTIASRSRPWSANMHARICHMPSGRALAELDAGPAIRRSKRANSASRSHGCTSRPRVLKTGWLMLIQNASHAISRERSSAAANPGIGPMSCAGCSRTASFPKTRSTACARR